MSDPVTLTHSQAVTRLKDIDDEMARLDAKEHLSPEDKRSFAELEVEFDRVNEHRERLEREVARARTQSVRDGLSNGNLVIDRAVTSDDYDVDAILEPDSVEDRRFKNPWDLSQVRTYGMSPGAVRDEFHARALSAIEQMPGCADRHREAATKILTETVDKPSVLARQILLTSQPAYMRAWSKLAKNPTHASLDADEQRALDEVEQFRAMSLTDNAGGYLVPFQLDPSVIITSDGSRNDIRSFARVVQATGDVWNGVSSGAVSWSYDAEAAEVSDDATTFAQPTVPIYSARGFVPISIEALADEQNVTAEVARLLAFGKDTLEATAFATGSGTGQPTGVITALAGGASEVAAAADDTFAIGDVYALQGALPARYRAGASWLANNLIYNLIRQFDTAGGAGLWERIGNDRPPALLGRPAGEAEAMDGTITTSGAVDNLVLLFGDFSNYVIADRVGMTVELVPHLFGNNNRPTGQRGWFATVRHGADSVNDGAFRLLNVASAA